MSKIIDSRAYATLITFEIDVEVDEQYFTYVGEWEFGKEHFYTVNDDYGNEVPYDDPIGDKVREIAKKHIADTAEDIRIERDY